MMGSYVNLIGRIEAGIRKSSAKSAKNERRAVNPASYVSGLYTGMSSRVTALKLLHSSS